MSVVSLSISSKSSDDAVKAQDTANSALGTSAAALTTVARISTDQVSVYLKLKSYEVTATSSGGGTTYRAAIDIEDEGPGVAAVLNFGVVREGVAKQPADLSGEALRAGEDVLGTVEIAPSYLAGLPPGNPRTRLLVWADVVDIDQKCHQVGYDPSRGGHVGGLLQPNVVHAVPAPGSVAPKVPGTSFVPRTLPASSFPGRTLSPSPAAAPTGC